MADFRLLTKEININRVITPHGLMRTERMSVRNFNESYSLHSITPSIDSLAPKIRDPGYLVASWIRLSELVESHRFLLAKDLKILCSYHGIPAFNLGLELMRLRLLEHYTCGLDCRNSILTFKVLTRPRLNVETKFLSTVMDIPPVPSKIGAALDGRSVRLPPACRLPEVSQFKVEDDSHLTPPPLALKESIIKEWQESLSAESLRRSPCAVCAKLVAHCSLKAVNAIDLDLSLLRNEQLPMDVRPTEYDFDLYERAILHPKGMHDRRRLGLLDVCHPCGVDLSKARMPKFALCNWLYYGRECLPPEVNAAFVESSVFERVLVARARSNVVSCRFSTKPTSKSSDVEPATDPKGKSFRHTRQGMKGNVVVTPMDIVRLNDHLPPSPEAVRDTLCIIFTGASQEVTKELLQSRKLQPVLVRKSRVKLLVEFLMKCNPHYGRVAGFKGFNEDYLDKLFTGTGDLGVPDRVEVAQLGHSDATDALNSGYLPRVDAPVPIHTPDSDALLMENVGYTLTDHTPHAYQQMKWGALERCLDKKPFLNLRRGTGLVPDFSNPFILSWILPHLDPWGIGGFHHPQRKRAISMEEQLSHMLQMDDDYFVKDPEFAFIFYNIIRKKSVSQSLRFSAPISKYRRIIDDILKVDRVQLVQLANKFDADPTYYPVNEEEMQLTNLLRSISASSAGVPGSVAQKVGMRNEIRAMFVAFGAPKLFVTLTPSDRDNILVQALTSTAPDIGDLMKGDALSDWQRNLLAKRNPAACALFFDHLVKGFLDIVLRYGKEGGGLYGTCTAYYGTVEAQGRGTLHCHLIVWLRGHPPPNLLQSLLSESQSYREKLFTWLESIMHADFLGENGRRVGSEAWNKRKEREMRGFGSIHPGAVVGPLIKNYQSDAFWEEYEMYVNQLLVEYHIHEHQPTCFKYLARWEEPTAKDCRMGITGEVFPATTLDPETMRITVKRTHPRMTHFTPLITFLLKCNSDVKFIGTGSEAKAFMYYVTDYITKPSMSMHVGLFALSYAIKRIEKRISEGKGATTGMTDENTVSAMTIAVNSMMGHQEISHPQVMSYLVGGGDHYTSETFHSFNWGSILSYVSSFWGTGSGEASESVSLAMKSGELMVSSQRLDYMLRSDQALFEAMCVYDFFATVRKAPINSVRKAALGEALNEKAFELECARFSSSDHPQFPTHGLRIRKDPCIPVLLGPSILKGGVIVDNEYRAMQILCLFKPWRQPSDLKLASQTWSEALVEFTPILSSRHKALISHFDILAESKEERDKGMNRRRQNKRRRVSGPGMTVAGLLSEVAEGGMFGDADFVTPVGSVFTTLSRDPAAPQVSVYSEDSVHTLAELIGPVCAGTLNQCYPLALAGAPTIPNSIDKLDVPCDEGQSDAIMDKEEVDSHIRHVAGMRLNHINTSSGDKRARGKLNCRPVERSGNTTVTIDRISETSPIPGPRNAIPLDYMSPNHPLEWRYSCLARVVKEKGLHKNPEQLRAFLIVGRHIVEGGCQLLMYIGGMGGTGKSHVVKSVVQLLTLLGRRDELLIGAPTGIAAVMIGGATLHSLIVAGTTKRQGISQKLADIWRTVQYLIIDEISMVGASFFAMLSNRMCIAKGDDPLSSGRPFGGINVISLGDFCQLKPVNQHSLFSSAIIDRPSFEQVRDNTALDATSGVYLWRTFRTVVQLRKNQRQIEDPVYGAVLSNIRLKRWREPINNEIWTEHMYMEYLRSRLLSRVATENPEELASFSDAPVIVSQHVLRDAINVKLIQYHSHVAKEPVHVYYARDAASGHPVDGLVQEVLWGLPSTKCGDMLGTLPLFIGMCVMILENLAISNGIVNGAEGTVRDVKYHLDFDGRRVADAVYVHVPGSLISLPGLDPDIVVIGPVATSIQFDFSVYSPRVTVQSFRRKQVPLVPAYSYTDYKSQGRSLDRCIVDLATAHGQGVYVMLSRARSLKGLLILRWFAATQIFQRTSEELRTELARLDALDEDTHTSFGTPLTFHHRIGYMLLNLLQQNHTSG